MQARLHSMLKDAMHITLKAEVTKNYTIMILYNYFLTKQIISTWLTPIRLRIVLG